MRIRVGRLVAVTVVLLLISAAVMFATVMFDIELGYFNTGLALMFMLSGLFEPRLGYWIRTYPDDWFIDPALQERRARHERASRLVPILMGTPFLLVGLIALVDWSQVRPWVAILSMPGLCAIPFAVLSLALLLIVDGRSPYVRRHGVWVLDMQGTALTRDQRIGIVALLVAFGLLVVLASLIAGAVSSGMARLFAPSDLSFP